jgi:hypothetical protein
MPRKTINVSKVLELANNMLAHPASLPDGREATCEMLETILFASGQYDGYRYLDTSEIEGGGTRREYFMKNGS